MHRQAGMLTASIVALTLITWGCDPEPSTQRQQVEGAAAQLGAEFDAARTGTISGRVRWQGAAPKIEPFTSTPYPVRFPRGSGGPNQQWPNPNAPRIDSQTNGVANAVVFLRGVDLARSRPWDHPPVGVDQRDHRYLVQQENQSSRIGFVRRGDDVEMLSTDREFYSLRARGAAFFTLIFPDPHSPIKRPLSNIGVVELRSGAGHYWMRAHLFVDDHPYYVRTDTQGRFTLPQVPAGTYELVTWMPNWHVTRTVQDWETSLTAVVDFAAPMTQSQRVTVTAGSTVRVETQITVDDFPRE